MARINSLTVKDGAVAFATAKRATLSNSTAAVVVARHVDATDTRATFLLAGQVNGSVTTLLDTRQVAVMGVLAGLGIGMVLAASRLFRRR